MDKHLVELDVYNALKRIEGSFKGEFDNIIYYAMTFGFKGDLEILNTLNLKQLSTLLINGYEPIK